ncbi:MAG: hypothetical protein NUW12_08240 [Firmicutes bacterium]|nr:hypothetical protein [Bacillota bacterium]MDH7495363.1 hypothetical protein [Bacillota bacterium]
MHDTSREEKLGFPWEIALPVVLGPVFFVLYALAPQILRPAISRIAGVSCFWAVYRAAVRNLGASVESPGPAAFRSGRFSRPAVRPTLTGTGSVCREFDELRHKLNISLTNFDYLLYTLRLKRAPEEVIAMAAAMEHESGQGATPEQIARVLEKMEECI